MKIIDRDEREAHASYLATEGAKGLFYGSLFSIGLFNYLRLKHPAKFNSFNASIKTCVIIMPSIACSAFWADQGSVVFDRRMHSQGGQAKIMQDFRDWRNKSATDKFITIVNDNRYKIAIAAWSVALGGSMVYVNRNKAMGVTQNSSKFRNIAIGGTGVFAVVIASLYANNKLKKAT